MSRITNASLIEYEGRTLLAARMGFVPSHLGLWDLDLESCVAENYRKIDPPIALAADDRLADPRLFLFRDKLHCAFTLIRRDHAACSQALCRIEPDGSVVDTTIFLNAQPHEKNWTFFEHRGELHHVYKIGDQHIVRNAMGDYHSTPGVKWNHGQARGGSPPLLVDGRRVAVFHSSRLMPGKQDVRRYAAGWYEFEAEPPFRVLSWQQDPIFRCAEETPFCPHQVVFPCGLVRRGDRFFCSYGYQDQEVRVAEVTANMRAVAPGKTVTWRH